MLDEQLIALAGSSLLRDAFGCAGVQNDSDSCMHFIKEKLTVLGEMKLKLVLEQQDFGKMKFIKMIKEETTKLQFAVISVKKDKFNSNSDLLKIN